MNRFLVTGGAGFIGSHLVETLLKKGHQVVILDNFCNSSKENLSFLANYPDQSYSLIEGDIRDKTCCLEATKNCDYILHHAALTSVPESMEKPDLYEDNNVKGTLTLLLAAKENNIKKVIQASSSAIYGISPALPKIETMTPTPHSPYASNKLACEEYGQQFTKHDNLPVISLRYFNVFGPRQNPDSHYAAVIPKFITTLLNDKTPVIYGDGNQTRDFIYIENIIQANLNSCFANESAHGLSFNIGSGTPISINTLTKKINKRLKKNTTYHYKEKRAGDVKDSLADITLAKKYIDYNNKITLDTGLDLTVNWYQTNKKHTQ